MRAVWVGNRVKVEATRAIAPLGQPEESVKVGRTAMLAAQANGGNLSTGGQAITGGAGDGGNPATGGQTTTNNTGGANTATGGANNTGGMATGGSPGTSCTTALNCVSAPNKQTTCDSSTGTCVQCVTAADCVADFGANNDCISKQCVSYAPCTTSTDCPNGSLRYDNRSLRRLHRRHRLRNGTKMCVADLSNGLRCRQYLRPLWHALQHNLGRLRAMRLRGMQRRQG